MAINAPLGFETYLLDNVVPNALKVDQESQTRSTQAPPKGGECHEPFDADGVALHTVTAGFDSVVQISAHYCANVLDQHLRPDPIEVAIFASDLEAFLSSQETLFDSPFLNNFDADTLPKGICKIRLTPRFSGLTFIDSQHVQLKYHAFIDIYGEERVWHYKKPIQAREELMELPPDERSSAVDEQITIYRFNSPASVGGHAYTTFEWKLLHEVGNVSLTLSSPYVTESDAARAQAQVFADLTAAQFSTDLPPGDAGRIYRYYLAESQVTLERQFLEDNRAPLTPKLSLVGTVPANEQVSEFPGFHVHTRHVAIDECQALALAFQVSPSAYGTIEDVSHFIGICDYGVISNGYVLERLFKHKWRLGGFHRRIDASTPITIQRNSETEDATLVGFVQLETLDEISIDMEPDLRFDLIRLVGQGTATATEFRLADGSVLDASEVDSGNVEHFTWQIATTPSLEPDWSETPDVVEFQRRAHDDAYKHVARPFATSTEQRNTDIVYCRLEGISGQVFVLGTRI